jgi:hypothetical protein
MSCYVFVVITSNFQSIVDKLIFICHTGLKVHIFFLPVVKEESSRNNLRVTSNETEFCHLSVYIGVRKEY